MVSCMNVDSIVTLLESGCEDNTDELEGSSFMVDAVDAVDGVREPVVRRFSVDGTMLVSETA